ncbi:hypothetical protein DFH09DRAFT_1319799 [Mycena vulgaris]|nr:hypothetical protein DFH09DRAFT_1319799 [Mycena vulgaris]
MSPEYLEDVYNSFSAEDGAALILSATSGAGEGLDVAGIDGVINYGIVSNIPMKSQRDGRAGRSTAKEAYCVHMIEPWVLDMDLSTAPIDPDDPDRPFSDAALTKKTPTKKERTGRAAIHFATCGHCVRVLLAAYFQDNSPEALEYTGRWCCDSDDHLGNTFTLERLFLSPVYTGTVATEAVKRKRNKYRLTKDRPELEARLIAWRTESHSNFVLQFVCPPSFILDDSAVKKLSMACPEIITSAASVTSLLGQSPEWDGLWAKGIFELISKFTPTAGTDEDDEDGESDKEEPKSKRRR